MSTGKPEESKLILFRCLRNGKRYFLANCLLSSSMKRFRKPPSTATCFEFQANRQVQDEMTLKGKITARLCLSDQQPEKENFACIHVYHNRLNRTATDQDLTSHRSVSMKSVIGVMRVKGLITKYVILDHVGPPHTYTR